MKKEEEILVFLRENRFKAPKWLNDKILEQVKRESRYFGFLPKRATYAFSMVAAVALLLFINTQFVVKQDTLIEWQNDSSVTALNEVTDLEDQLVLLDADYRQTTSTTISDDATDDYDSSNESISLLNSLYSTE